MRNATLVAATVASLALLAGEAHAHGGAYRGPGGPVPGPAGGPGTGGGAPGGGGGGRGPMTGGGLTAKKTPTKTYTDFATFWDLNKHRYLNLRARLRSRTAITGDQRRASDLSGRPEYDELVSEVIPLLRRLCADRDADVADSAVLALARVTPGNVASESYSLILGTLARKERSVRQSALVSLGVLGDRAAVAPLIGVLLDDADGRRTMSATQAIATDERGFAAVALGLIGDESAVAPLIASFRDDRSGGDELRAAILLALGLFREPSLEATSFLIDRLDDDRLSQKVRAQIPIALMRHRDAARSALPRLLAIVKNRKTENLLRQSCTLALGELASPDDEQIIEALLDAAERASDDGASHFAWLALGSIGGRAAFAGETHAELVKQLQRALLRGVMRPRDRDHVAWAAFACALLGRELPRDGVARQEIERRLEDAFEDASAVEHRAAIGIALGLLERRQAERAVLREFEATRDYELSATLAESLGLMRSEDATPALRTRLETESDPKLKARLAIALGLLGDLEVSPRLVKELEATQTLYGLAALAKAIGVVGDRSALAPLVKRAEGDGPALSRAFSAVALGLLGEKQPLPWNARVAENANYLANFTVLTEVLDIL
jgi:HEAT repeat protein